MGLDFINTMIVRQVSERGISSSDLPVKPVDFMGDEKKNLDRFKLAGDMWIMSAKGTSI